VGIFEFFFNPFSGVMGSFDTSPLMPWKLEMHWLSFRCCARFNDLLMISVYVTVHQRNLLAWVVNKVKQFLLGQSLRCTGRNAESSKRFEESSPSHSIEPSVESSHTSIHAFL